MTKLLYKVSQATGKVQEWSAWSEDALVFTKYGQRDGKMQTKSFTAIATNVGRSNERNPEEQAVEEVGKLYIAQCDNKHYDYDLDKAFELFNSCKEPRKIKNYKDNHSKMPEVLLTSVKLNGSRACVIEGSLYSKIGKKEDVKVLHIKEAIEVLKDYSYDTEVYCHGLSLQRIRSAWLKPIKTDKEIEKFRKERAKALGKDEDFFDLEYNPNDDAGKLCLYVFDIPITNVEFINRVKLMEDLEVIVNEKGLQDVIKFQYPSVSKSHEERLERLELVVSEGFEGLVHYQLDDLYLFGTRSSTTCKAKLRYSSEAYCTGVEKCKNGEGKLLLRACDELEGVEFTAMMKGTHAERMYDNQINFIGQWLTFEYEEISDSGTPTKGVVQETRLCDSAGQPME